MTDFIEYTPPADGVAPRGWVNGMAWDLQPTIGELITGDVPSWFSNCKYRIPPEALHYPIAPFVGEWGAEIEYNGWPNWLPDMQDVSLYYEGKWRQNNEWRINFASKIRLPESHGYYADNTVDQWMHVEPVSAAAFDAQAWLDQGRANADAVVAIGVTLPEPEVDYVAWLPVYNTVCLGVGRPMHHRDDQLSRATKSFIADLAKAYKLAPKDVK